MGISENIKKQKKLQKTLKLQTKLFILWNQTFVYLADGTLLKNTKASLSTSTYLLIRALQTFY